MSSSTGVTLRTKTSSLKKVGEVYEGVVVLEVAVHDLPTWEDLLVVVKEFDIYSSQDIKTQIISALKEEKKEREQKAAWEKQELEDTIHQMEEKWAEEQERVKGYVDTLLYKLNSLNIEKRALVIRLGQLQKQLSYVVDSVHEDSRAEVRGGLCGGLRQESPRVSQGGRQDSGEGSAGGERPGRGGGGR
jgi:hypothetical protein